MGAAKFLLWCFLGSLAALVGIVLYSLMYQIPPRADLFQVSYLTALYSLTGLGCVWLRARGGHPMLVLVNSVVIAIAFLCGMLEAWLWSPWGSLHYFAIYRFISPAWNVANFVGYFLLVASLLRTLKVRSGLTRGVRSVTIVFGLIAVTIGCVISVFGLTIVMTDAGELATKLATALGLFAMLGVPATLCLRWLEHIRHANEAETGLPVKIRIHLSCPRCSLAQDVFTGEWECAGCGLQIFLQVKEPVCDACGYSLAGLTGDVCPECAAEIPEPQRMLAARATRFEVGREDAT